MNSMGFKGQILIVSKNSNLNCSNSKKEGSMKVRPNIKWMLMLSFFLMTVCFFEDKKFGGAAGICRYPDLH